MATVLIIGAGISGPVLAIHLKNKGYKPIIFEKIKEIKDVGGSLMIAPNGYRALSMVGLDKKIEEVAIPITHTANFKSDGTELSSVDIGYFKEMYKFPSVGSRRSVVHKIVINGAIENEIPIHFGKRLARIEDDPSTNYVTAIFSDGTQYQGDFLVGCDGLHSTTRAFLFGQETPVYNGMTQLSGHSPRPPGYRNIVYNIYGINSFVISYPTSSTHVGWSLSERQAVMPETNWKSMDDAEMKVMKQTTPAASWAEPIATLVRTAEQLIKGGLYDRPSIPKWYKGRCVLLGDAAHPTSPHLGQGANQALVDCMILVKSLLEYPTDLEKAFSAYETERIPYTSMLVAGARAQGELRVIAGEDACAQRDEQVRHMYDDREKGQAQRDRMFKENF